MSQTARQALALTATIWLVVSYGGYAVAELIAGRAGFIQDLPLDFPAVLIVALLAFCLYPVAALSFPHGPLIRWLVVLTAAVVVAFGQSIVNLIENRLLGVIPALTAEHLPLIRQRFGRNFLAHLYMCLTTGALFIFLIEARRSEEERLQRLRAERLAADARMAALSLQMNPHFLFNALNGVSSLILSGETAAAESMVGGLADFLRRTLRADPAEPVALSEEFARVAAYLQLEEMRFEDQLKVELSLPDELRNVPVLPFLLQPLVENAVKYGVARSRRNVTICVTASRSLEELVLEVADDADVTPTAEPGLSIGITNIAERLAARYGARASIRAAPVQPGFVSRVRLPLT